MSRTPFAIFFGPLILDGKNPFKDEAQTVLIKDPYNH